MFPVLFGSDGGTSFMHPKGIPAVKEMNSTDLSMEQSLKGGGTFSIVCREKQVTFCGKDAQGKPLKWAWKITGGEGLKAVVKKVKLDAILYDDLGVDYQLKLDPVSGSCHQLEDGSIQLTANAA